MKVTVLASGSKGNCIYIEGNGGAILVDAGISSSRIRSSVETCGGDISRIEGLCITHEHSDHIRGIDVLTRQCPMPVFGTGGTLAGIKETLKCSGEANLRRVVPKETVNTGTFQVTPFSTFHDASDPTGFCISDGEVCVGVCTDTGMVTSAMMEFLSRCDILVLESNHCSQMLENGPYPAFLKQRIADKNRGHLSNRAASNVLSDLCSDLSVAVLAHLSEENNTPEKALTTARETIGLFSNDVELEVGLQHALTRTIEV
ncbi:MAG: MBL fold metallo-hydrolase [Methanomicrobiales archaeon]|nr:MBL fold metallo-hydrolase [Methanomicrobiales archaeon]